jgi:hypothetical protein
MTRNLKALGLALAAMLAIGAVAASSASADFMTEGDQDVTLTVAANSAQVFSAPSFGEFECEGFTTEDEAVAPGKSLHVAPTFSDCLLFYGENEVIAKFVFTSCEYSLITDGRLAIECEPGDYIHMVITALSINCFTFEGNQEYSEIRYANRGTGSTRGLDLEVDAADTKYTAVGVCGEETTREDMSWQGKLTVDADEADGGKHIGLWHEEGEWE